MNNNELEIIQKAIEENEKWKSILPAFYFLKEYPEIDKLINEETFLVKDWNNAIIVMLQLNKIDESIQLANKTLNIYPNSSYIFKSFDD